MYEEELDHKPKAISVNEMIADLNANAAAMGLSPMPAGAGEVTESRAEKVQRKLEDAGTATGYAYC